MLILSHPALPAWKCSTLAVRKYQKKDNENISNEGEWKKYLKKYKKKWKKREREALREQKRWSDEEADKEYNKYFTSPAPSKISNRYSIKQLKSSKLTCKIELIYPTGISKCR